MMLKVVLLAWLLCEGDLIVGDVVVPDGVVGGHGVYRERRGGEETINITAMTNNMHDMPRCNAMVLIDYLTDLVNFWELIKINLNLFN